MEHSQRQHERDLCDDGTILYPDGSGLVAQTDGKESTWNVGDLGLIPGLGRSPVGRHGNPLQYSSLENPMDRGAWWLQSLESRRAEHD